MTGFRWAAPLALLGASVACVGPQIEIRSEFEIFVAGENEVCDPGERCGGSGYGQASVQIDDQEGRLCYDLDLTDIPDAMEVHIHEGDLQETGPVILDLEWEANATSGERCLEGLEDELLSGIRHNPRLRFIQVHSKTFPDGAARGHFQS